MAQIFCFAQFQGQQLLVLLSCALAGAASLRFCFTQGCGF
jgi:hypothetical protein